ncbi:MAG: GNAT family N-acetyltransferase [Rickettsiales bacterium]
MTEAHEYKLARLGAESAAEFRAIRLEALETYPINFASAYEVECDWPLSAFEDRLKQWLHVGAYHNSVLVGVATLVPQIPARMKHKADITSVYVKPDYQGKGVAKAMFAWLEAEAAKEFDQVHLSVLAANDDACRLYEHLGYKAYGVEPRATKYQNQYYDDVFMVKFLK